MNKLKILVLEDNESDVKIIQNKLKNKCEILPKQFVENDREYANGNYLLEKVKTIEGRKDILKELQDIDVFIIDITLGGNDNTSNDSNGLEFFKLLKGYSYREGKFDCIFITRHAKASEYRKELDILNQDNKYKVFSKETKTKGDYSDEIASYLNKKYGIKIPHNKEHVDQQEKDKKLKAKLDRLISGGLYLLMVFALLSAFINISIDITKPLVKPIINYHQHKILERNRNAIYDSISHTPLFSKIEKSSGKDTTISESENSNNNQEEIKKLEVVENIFIYLLPLFIIFGFYNYYKYTTSIIITDGNYNDIDNNDALKYLNASKIILVSSLLSFAIIKVLEKVFISDVQDIVSLISYGVFLIILITFLLLLHSSDINDKKSENK